MSSHPDTHPPVAKTPFLAAAALFLGVAGLVAALSIRPLGAAELLGLLACVAAASVFAAIPFVVDFTRRLDAARRPAVEPRSADIPVAAPRPGLSSAELDTLAAALASRLPKPPAPELPLPLPPADPAPTAGQIAAQVTELLQPQLNAHLASAIDARLDAALPAWSEQLAASFAAAQTLAEEKRRAEIQAAIAATTPPGALDTASLPASAAPSGSPAKPRLGRGLAGLIHGANALGPPPASRETAGIPTDDRAAA